MSILEVLTRLPWKKVTSFFVFLAILEYFLFSPAFLNLGHNHHHKGHRATHSKEVVVKKPSMEIDGYELDNGTIADRMLDRFIRLHWKHATSFNSTGKGRFMFMELQYDNNGFGNKLRYMHSAMLFALATDRALVIESPLLQLYFQPPDDLLLNWNADGYPVDMHSPRLSSEKLNPYQMEYRHIDSPPDLDRVYPSDVVIVQGHNDGTPTSYDRWLLYNRNYGRKLRRLLGLPQDWAYEREEITERTMRLLLKKPTRWYMKYLDQIVRRMSFYPGSLQESAPAGRKAKPNDVFVTIRIRLVVLFPGPEKFLECADRMLEHVVEHKKQQLGVEKINLKIFVTADKVKVRDTYAKHFSQFGEVFVNPESNDRETNHALKLHMPPNDPHPAMVDWWLLGECDAIIGGFTTFLNYGAARTGRPMQYRNDIDGCGYFSKDIPDEFDARFWREYMHKQD